MQDNIKNDFLDYLLIAYEYLKVEYKGILIVIDDINGLSNSKEFVDWYKSFADTLNVEEYYHLPLYFLLASYPDKFDNMVLLEKSFGRLFHFAHVDELSDGQVKEFFKDSFKSVNLEINDELINNLLVKEEANEEIILYTLICNLEPIYKDIILLYYYDDMKTNEIAKLLKKKESTIRMRLHRARNILKERMEEYENGSK